jgi:hypothetical protein
MPILGPITSPARLRSFGVIDLEWVPATRMPLPENVDVHFEGMRSTCKIPLPVSKRISEPLKVRLASFYDQPTVDEGDMGDEPVRQERFLCFDTVRELNDFVLSSENRGRWIYAHAGGLADMEFVLDDLFAELKTNLDARTNLATVVISEELKQKGIDKIEHYVKGSWKIRASFSGSSAIIIHVSRGKNAWHFLDSYWLFRDSLASIGKAIGIKKGDSLEAVAFLQRRFGKPSFDELDDKELESFYRDAPVDVLKSYNRIDCEILWKAIAQFEQEILELGGQLQQTIASTGMNLIRRAYLKEPIYTSERLNQVAEEAYSSSRVEVHSRFIEDCKGYDINSSFPFSMTLPQPGCLREVRTTLPDIDSDDCIYLADVTVEVPDTPLPPLPFRQGGRVFFPTGRWRAWFDSTDIRLALREGATLHKVHEVYVFEPFHDIRDFVVDIYGKRAATKDPFRKILYKYLLNCPYGKFAEGVWKQEMLINPDKIERDKLQLLQPGIWLAEKKATVAHRHVPISCHITALSRRLLFDYMKDCITQGFPSAYVDTDSLATRAELPVDETKLGALKLEKKITWAEFFVPKIYRGEGFELGKDGQWKPIQITKAKGFSLGRKARGEAWERFNSIASGDRIGIQRQVRMRELYRTGETAPVDVLVIKALMFDALTKRFHYPDGETRPWTVTELASGDVYPRGFDFEPEIEPYIDTTTRAMMEAVV